MVQKRLAPEGNFLSNAPCPTCRAKNQDRHGNNLAVYSSNTAYCFRCGTYINNYDGTGEQTLMSEAIAKNEELDESTADSVKFLYNPKEVQSDRGITVSTFEHYGVQTNNDVHVYPFKDKDNNLLVCQIRYLDNKRFDFDRHGVKPSRLLWGSHLFPKGSAKNIIITEGMLDAMSAYQMMTGRVPCVSLPNGTESVGKALENNFEYLDSFENIYVCFDNDDPVIVTGKQIGRAHV